VFGSGTQGLQRRTLSPPPRVVTSDELPALAGSTVGRVIEDGDPSPAGGWTMYWYGIVIRWGEHEAQTTRPHFLSTS
jgi:hypothetical protein